MIVITYDPPNAESQRWEIDEDSWTYGETVELERQYGGTRKEFFEDARLGSDTARRTLLWIIRRRTEPDLQVEDLNSLLVAYVGFWQVTPGADPKAQEEPAADAETPETPDPDSGTE